MCMPESPRHGLAISLSTAGLNLALVFSLAQMHLNEAPSAVLRVDPISPSQEVWLVFKSSYRTESRSERDVHELSWLEIFGLK